MEEILYFNRGGESFLSREEELALERYLYAQYPGKRGSKVQKRFVEDGIRFLNLLIEKMWFWSKKGEAFATRRKAFPKGIPFSKKEEVLLQNEFGLSNVRKLKKFMIEHGILVPQKSIWGTDYSYKRDRKYCKHYEITLEKCFHGVDIN